MQLVIYWMSISLVGAISIYFWYQTARFKSRVSTALGMRIAMSNAMMSSLIIGTILGIVVMRMFLPSIVGVMVGITVGYLIGRNFGLTVVVDALMSGIMGGMMGAMLGVMMMGDHVIDMVLFLDLIYIAIMGIQWKWVLRDHTTINNLSVESNAQESTLALLNVLK